MNIFYETIEKFNDFKSRINIKIDQLMPEFSLLDNIINSYSNVLDEKSKLENEQFIKIKEKLELVKQQIEDKRSAIIKLEPLIINFQDTYKKNSLNIELKYLSQKAYIRIKEEELKNYLLEYEVKLKEKAEIDLKKEEINQEITSLKNKIDKKCFEYIGEVSGKNIENLKSGILSISEKFIKLPVIDKEINSDYLKTEEYLNSLSEYKEAYNKMYSFMSEVFEEIQKFINESNVENILPDLLLIQDELKKKYNDFDRIELEANKIADFLNLKESYEQVLLDAEKELENISKLINQDEELLALKTEIENYIEQNG